MESKNKPSSIDPSQIYPTTSKQVSIPHGQSQTSARGDLIVAAQNEMSGIRLRPQAAKSKEVDAVAGLIVLSGVLAILSNHRIISIGFSVVYILVGLGIFTRSAIARKMVIFASAAGLALNILNLFVFSSAIGGKASILPVLSMLFSIAVQLVVLSVLTWHQNEAEFH